MGLTYKKEKQLSKMPIVQSRISRSEDGRFLIHKTIFTDIKPIEYYEAVMSKPVETFVTEEAD
ncbi:MAG: hypothetical protein GXP63_03625 [DPANN group archaeon]|nr:hypothetical protein [DPANN group archaeon]